MTQRITEVRIFLAAPSDVASECRAVSRAVAQINRLYRGRGVALRIVSWRTDARPAAGEDPQAVINKQVGDDYDALVAILWSRLGTPTPRAGSGTEEEFDRAMARRARGDDVEVMVYFKTADLPQAHNPQQWEAVEAFKTRVRGRGVLYSEVGRTSEFERDVLIHLNELANANLVDSSGNAYHEAIEKLEREMQALLSLVMEIGASGFDDGRRFTDIGARARAASDAEDWERFDAVLEEIADLLFEQAAKKREAADREAVAFNEVLATFNVALAHLTATKLQGKDEALASFIKPVGAVKKLLEGAITGYESELAGFKAFPTETMPRLDAARVRYQSTILDLIAETRGLMGTVRTVERVVTGGPK